MKRYYQGALVECFNSGVFIGDIVKLDVRSMYPTIMVVLNLSPESVRIKEVTPASTDVPELYMPMYKFSKDEIAVPDDYVGRLVVSIDAEHDSVTRTEMLKFMDLRGRFKREGNRSGDQAVKLIMNALYGYNGLVYSRYGSFPVAIVTAATGRFIMQKIIDYCKGLVGRVVLLEADTDGLLVQTKLDLENEVNGLVRAEFKDFSYADLLKVECERFDAAIIHKSKNYVLKRGSELIFKGSAFKGRHMPPICMFALECFARAIFSGDSVEDVWNEFNDLKTFPLKDFTMNIQFGKDIRDYDPHTLYVNLMRQLQAAGYEATWGQDVRYVACEEWTKTKVRQKPKKLTVYRALGTIDDVTLKRTLDYGYYRDRIRGVVGRLLESVKESPKTRLEDFM